MMVHTTFFSNLYISSDQIAGKSSEPGKIDFEVLKSAIRNGDGGMDPSDAEELMTMMHNIPGGEVDYMEMIDLFLGSSRF